MPRLIFNSTDYLKHWVAQRIRYAGPGFGPCAAIGVISGEGELKAEDRILAAVVYHDYHAATELAAPNVQLSIAAVSPIWARPHIIRDLLAYPFVQLKCGRITSLVAKKNRRARDLALRVGFKLEGVLRDAIIADDLCVYGMTRRDWTARYLEKANESGERRADTPAAA